MPRFAANLSMLFTEQDFLVRFQAAANAGFHGVEYLFPYDYNSADIKAQLRQPGGREQLMRQLQSGQVPPSLAAMGGLGGMPGMGGMPDLSQMQNMMQGGLGGLMQKMMGGAS